MAAKKIPSKAAVKSTSRGAPVQASKPARPGKPTPLHERAAPAGWVGIASIVPLSDGRVFAGSHEGQAGVCLWDADGALRWTTALPATGLDLDLDVSPERVFAHARETRTAWSLDPSTGAILERHDIGLQYGVWCPRMRMSPDGKHVVARLGTEAEVFSLPGLAHVAHFSEYANESPIAFSADGHHVAVCGHEVHVYAVKGWKHLATFDADSPCQLAFLPSGLLVTADGESRVCLFERDGTLRARLDAMPERKSKKPIEQLAVHDETIAVVRGDGEIVVFERATERARFSKLAPTAIALTDRLWVGTSRLAIYAL